MPRASTHWFGPLSAAAVRKLYDILAKLIVPKTELRFASDFELLVAVVLSAQATDRAVNAATAELFQVAKSPQDMVRLGEKGLIPYIKHIGLFNTKARNIVELSRLLIERHSGKVPARREGLEALPGVGRKTANVVLNVAFKEPTIAVDTHIHRVANRTGIATTRTPEQTELVLLARTPDKHLLAAHHYLILHGRYTCVARQPLCWRCPVARVCVYDPKTQPPAE